MKKKHTKNITEYKDEHYSDINELISAAASEFDVIGNNKGVKYYNLPCAFDIETTSFYTDADGRNYDYNESRQFAGKLEKRSIMYIWYLGINGRMIHGRTWEEFTAVLDAVSKGLELGTKKRLIIYVHNLSYEFQFIRNLFTWEKVFSTDLRKPLYALTTTGIEFRCSYLLSGYSLDMLGKQLQTYKVTKLTGGLDYSKIRHAKTPLTPTELMYCINDIKVVMYYIREQIEACKGINKIPLTKTGYVRKYCRRETLLKHGKRNYKYYDFIHSMNITGIEEFNMLQRAFAGGFTHASNLHAGDIIDDVSSYDFTSSYPYVMISEKYPASTGVRIECKSMKQFEFLTSKYLCIFDVEFSNLFPAVTYEHPISYSKCFIHDDVTTDNGRVVTAKRIAITITNIDFDIIKNFYTWDSIRIGIMYVYQKDYLPTEFVSAILKLYGDKTKLKGVAGKEKEYLSSKEMLNSCYGMCVTNPLRDEFTYDGVWDINELTPEKQLEMLEKYNNSRNRFLSYTWGVFVTAYARRNLFTGIYECKEDYIYSDTDSIKLVHADRHKDYFKAYNNMVEYKLRAACKHHNLDFDLVQPETIKGITKILGVWDYEGTYRRFKTLGAKRYMIEEEKALTAAGVDYNYSLTVSGVNKTSAIPYLVNKYGTGIFKAFDNYLEIPAEHTGKNIHTYIDYEQTGTITDYLGTDAEYKSCSGVHLEPTGYSLSLSVMYLNYLIGVKLKDD